MAAGRELGRIVAERPELRDERAPALVLGLPRGGVPVAAEVARAIGGQLDVFMVRKLGVPGQPELAMGAVASGGVEVFNDDVIASLRWLREQAIAEVVQRERRELDRRERAYRGDRPPAEPTGRRVLLVDDGIATGASMRAAVQGVLGRASSVTVAVPVASRQAVEELRETGAEVVAACVPARFGAVGYHYSNFAQVSDDDVRAVLAKAAAL